MSFALAFAAPTFGGVAADTSGYNRRSGAGGHEAEKIIRAPGGWATGAGYPPVLQAVYRELLVRDVPLGEVDVAALVRAVAARLTDEDRASIERGSGSVVANNHVLTAARMVGGFLVRDTYFDGDQRAGVPVALNWPIEDGQAQAVFDALRGEVPMWTEPRQAVRRIAALVALCHATGVPTCSERVHVGFTVADGREYFLEYFLRPTSCEVVLAADDAELDALVGPPLGPEVQNMLRRVVRTPEVENGRRVTTLVSGGSWVESANRLGIGPKPSIDYLALSMDPRGDVRVTVHVRNGKSVRVAASKSAFPSKATVQAAAPSTLDADKSFVSGVLQTVREDETSFVSALAYETLTGGGAESETLYKVEGRAGERFRAKVYNSANQSIPNSTVTALTFDSEDHDVGVLHDTATNNSRITIPTGGNKGQWLLVATVAWDLNAAGVRTVRIRKNGSLTVAESLAGSTASGATQNVVAIVDAPAVGDYFEVVVIQSSGGNLNVISGVGNTFFTAVHLW